MFCIYIYIEREKKGQIDKDKNEEMIEIEIEIEKIEFMGNLVPDLNRQFNRIFAVAIAFFLLLFDILSDRMK